MQDFVIVGGGSAGCTLAARLSELGDARVLLLESGPPDRDRNIHAPAAFYKMMNGPLTWGYRTAPLRQADSRNMIYPQARVLGGGSSINAMVYTRGNAADYDAWEREEGCEGWSYSGVLPYFRRAEDNERFRDEFHGGDGPLGVSDQVSPHYLTKAFVRAAQEAGIPYNPDFNGARQEGCGLYQVTQRGAKRCSAAVGYLGPALARANLTLRTDCRVTRILVENGRAVGVEYREGAGGGLTVARAGQEVIVAAGAIGSPRLLLLSGIGPADELREVGVDVVHDLPGVGKNLQDHIDVYTINELSGPHSYDQYKRLDRELWAGAQWKLFGSGPATSNIAEGGAFWWADREQAAPDLQFHFLPGAGVEPGVPPLAGAGCTLNSCHLRPRSRGRVTLRTADPGDAARDRPELLGRPLRLRDVATRLRARPRDHVADGVPEVRAPRAPARAEGEDPRRNRGARASLRQDRLSPRGHVQDGGGRNGRRRSLAPGARSRRPAGGRFLRHAPPGELEHQRTVDHDRREGERSREGQPGPRAAAVGGADRLPTGNGPRLLSGEGTRRIGKLLVGEAYRENPGVFVAHRHEPVRDDAVEVHRVSLVQERLPVRLHEEFQ